MFCSVGRADAPSAAMRVEMQTLAENMLDKVVVNEFTDVGCVCESEIVDEGS